MKSLLTLLTIIALPACTAVERKFDPPPVAAPAAVDDPELVAKTARQRFAVWRCSAAFGITGADGAGLEP